MKYGKRNALAGQLELLEKLLAIERLFKAARFAVDGQCDHDGNCRSRF